MRRNGLGLALAAVFGAALCAAPAAHTAAADDGKTAAGTAKTGSGLELDLKGGASLIYKSEYTHLDLDECMAIEPSATEEGPGWAHRICDGLSEAWPVHVFESDLRYAVSYGRNGESEPAAGQWFGPFNRINTTLEWVMARESTGDEGGEKLTPVATILRFFLSIPRANGKPRVHPILVVTQLKPGAVCQIAFVDARANKNANEDARFAAARLTGPPDGPFDCANDPELVGPQSAGVFAE